MSTLLVDTLQDLAGTGSPVIGGFAKASVNFNGTGTVAIRAAFNVSSITDNGVGVYTVNFTNSLPSANYATLATTKRSSTVGTVVESPNLTATTTAFSLTTFVPSTLSNADAEYISATVF